jgi:hypothetical protein
MTTTIGNLMFQSAEKAGDSAKARLYSERLVALTSSAETERPEVKSAKQFLAKS